MSPSENFNIKGREATTIGSTPPPSVSPSESLNIKRREVRVVGSTPPPEPSLSLPEDLPSTGLPRIQTATNFDAALEQILQLPFDDRLLKVSMNDLAYKVSEGRDSPLTLNFATLYRMRLHKLRSEMVKHVFEIRYHNKLATGWEAALKEYGGSKQPIVYTFSLQS